MGKSLVCCFFSETQCSCFEWLSSWRCLHTVPSRAYETVEGPSVRPSVCLSVRLCHLSTAARRSLSRHSSAAAACSEFAAECRTDIDRQRRMPSSSGASARGHRMTLSSKCEQFHVYSWRRKLDTDLFHGSSLHSIALLPGNTIANQRSCSVCEEIFRYHFATTSPDVDRVSKFFYFLTWKWFNRKTVSNTT